MVSVSFCLLLLGLAAADTTDYAHHNWRQSQGVYEVYGVTLEKFLELHPFTLLLIYDDSPESKNALELLPELHNRFSSRSIHVVVAKMRKNDGPRWFYEWNVRKLPYFRLIVGDGVSATTRAYPDIQVLVDWVFSIYNNQKAVIEVNSEDLKKKFHLENDAFYLRFNPQKEDYFELLTKFQMISPHLRVFYATNPAFDVFDRFNADETVIGFKRSFDEPLKLLSSPDKLNRDNIQRFFQSYAEASFTDLTEDLLETIVTQRTRTALYFGSNLSSKTLEAFRYIAFEQKDNLLFVIVGEDKVLEAETKKRLHIDEDTFDEIRIVDFDGQKFRVFKVEGTTLQEISASFEKYGAGKLQEINQSASHLEDIAGEL
jgi:hypothetical protein